MLGKVCVIGMTLVGVEYDCDDGNACWSTLTVLLKLILGFKFNPRIKKSGLNKSED